MQIFLIKKKKSGKKSEPGMMWKEILGHNKQCYYCLQALLRSSRDTLSFSSQWDASPRRRIIISILFLWQYFHLKLTASVEGISFFSKFMTNSMYYVPGDLTNECRLYQDNMRVLRRTPFDYKTARDRNQA